MTRNKIITSMLGGAVALGLLGGAAAYAQSATPSPSAPSTDSTQQAPALQGDLGGRGFGHGIGGPEGGQYLADALGISLTDLQTAQETARIAMIDQAVADGLITQAQADQMKLYSGMGLREFGRFGYDEDEYLADALGISVDALNVAEQEAYEASLADAVEAGYLTQEQADLMIAQRAVENYVDTDAISAQLQSSYEAALSAAVADGAITQAQADTLLAQMQSDGAFTFRGFGGGHGGPGGPGGHGGRGGHGPDGDFGGFGFGQAPSVAPDSTTTPQTSTSQGA